VSPLSFLDPQSSFRLPANFDFEGYIDAERELWALFPETTGKRVNFCQLGLTATLYAEVADPFTPLSADETYFLMPCADINLRPVRMRAERPLTLEEFRMTHITAMRMMEKLSGTGRVMDEVHLLVLGPTVLAEGVDPA
jgi:hypothetical protein